MPCLKVVLHLFGQGKATTMGPDASHTWTRAQTCDVSAPMSTLWTASMSSHCLRLRALIDCIRVNVKDA
eukprot:11208941-Lingulodinium_polyedra.AAC.1